MKLIWMHDDNVAREAITCALAVVEAMYASERTTNRVGIVSMGREAEAGKNASIRSSRPGSLGRFTQSCFPTTNASPETGAA